MFIQNKITLSLATAFILANNLHAKEIQSLDTIMVTAQKTEENIQEVPISMTVFDEFSIEDRKIESIENIAPYTSNFLLLNKANNYYSPSIRGISQAQGYSLSNPVSVVVDGIPVASSLGFNEILMDIKRIEVLKGPQSTLYGKETQAGVINVITKKPDNETRIKLQGELGSDNKKELSLSASGAIIEDKLFIGLSAKHYEKDGFIKNRTLGGFANDKEYDYGRLHFRYTPSDNLEISLISSKHKLDNGDGDFSFTSNPDNRSITSSVQGYDKSDTTSHALKISYDINDYLFESITTHREYKTDALQNYHFAPIYDFHALINKTHKKTTQEFRLSNNSSSFKWLAGVYADKDKLDEDSSYVYTFGAYPTQEIIDGDSLGVFVHTDYAMSDKLSFISGLRYDKDESSFEGKSSNTNLEISNNEISPKISLKYQYDKNSMYYATVAKGYRAGGFHPYAPSTYPKQYDSEVLWNYEIGAKNSFLNNKLIVNSSIFYMDIDDMQVSVYPDVNSFKTYIDNAAQATSKGFEIELNAKLTDSLELFGSYGYMSAKFDEYKDTKGDYSGNNTIYAPKYNYNLGVQYRDNQGYFARADLNGYGKTYFNKENTLSRDAYNLVNAKIGYETENFDIYLYGKNIFDKKYDSIGMYGSTSVVYSEPREVGIQVAYRF